MLVLVVEQADAANVGMLAVKAVQPTETQPVVRHVQPLHLFGKRTYPGVPIHQCPAILDIDGTPQRRAVPTLHSRALGVEPCVERGHVAPLGPQFLFVPVS